MLKNTQNIELTMNMFERVYRAMIQNRVLSMGTQNSRMAKKLKKVEYTLSDFTERPIVSLFRSVKI